MSSAESPPVNGGPWGPFMDVIMCLLPIIALVIATLKPNPWPTTTSLPVAAVLMWVVTLAYLGADPLQTCALVIKGLLSAWTPITIVAGAIFLFECMESSRCLDWMRVMLKSLTLSHPIAEFMLIGFAFPYLIEGASGFGTPAALAAPMLMSMGHPKLETVCALLLTNTFATVFGAVGTPVWFGFGDAVEDDPATLRAIGWRCALVMGVAAMLLVPVVATLLVPRSLVRRNLIFIWLSTLSCAAVSIGISTFSYEFPSLLGGVVGCGITALLIKYHVGLTHEGPAHDDHDDDAEMGPGGVRATGEDGPSRPAGTGALPVRGPDEGTIPPPIIPHRSNSAYHGLPDDEKKGRSAPEPTSSSGRGSSGKGGKLKTASVMPGVHHQASHEEVDVDARTHSGGDSEDLEAAQAAADLDRVRGETTLKHAIGRMMPLWLTVLLLIITRIEEFELQGMLRNNKATYPPATLGTLGTFSLSYTGILSIKSILSVAEVSWSYEFLYVPFILPFLVSGGAALLAYRQELKKAPKAILLTTVGRMVKPAVSLFGALVLVTILRGVPNDRGAPAYVLGVTLADALSHGWLVFSFPIGVLGSFFSGSTTVSNLTFGAVQLVAAERLGVHKASMLALQACGATSGNAVCLNNIIAASAVVGLNVSEGTIMMRTGPIVALAYVIATAMLIPFIYAGQV